MKATILKASALVFGLSILGRLTGFGREVAIAFTFGTSEQADAIIVGLTPLVLFTGILGSAYTAAAMVYIRAGDNKQSIRETVIPLMVFSVVGSFLICVFARPLITTLAPTLTPDAHNFAVVFTQITAPAIALNSLASWSIGIAHLRHRFLGPALAVIMPNLGLLVAVLVAFRVGGAALLAITALFGYFLQFLIVFNRKDYSMSFREFRNIFSSRLWRMYRNVGLTFITTFVVYIDMTLDRWMALQISEGAVAALNYSSKLVQLPNYTLIFALITVMFPRLIQAEFGSTEAHRQKRFIYLMTFLLSIGVTTVLYFGASLITQITFEYGAFDAASTKVTANLLQVYGLGFIGFAFTLIGVRIRFSQNDFVTPVWAGLAALVTKVSLNFILIDAYEVAGLAFATAAAACVNGAILTFSPMRQEKSS
jgi:putative peptidoglycan lipid II flippase